MALKLFGKEAENFENNKMYKFVAHVEYIEGRTVVTLIPLYYINDELGVDERG